jgi:hypothetical protein
VAGQIIPVISKREYDFGTGDATVIAVKAVAVTGFREGTLLVRVHSSSFGGSSKIDVIAKTTAPSSEEPSLDFVNATAVATATVNSSSGTAGTLVKAALSDDFGAYLQISVVGDLDTGDCKATISVEIVVKD